MNEVYQKQPVISKQRNRPVNRCLPAKASDLSLSLATRRRRRLGIIGLCGLIFFLWGSQAMRAQPSMSEYQVKALFLLNFVKYVDWPAGESGPITIGILGQDNFNDSLTNAADGKTVNGRAITIKHFSLGDSLSGCSILFISASENPQLSAILSKTVSMPILTVGESDSFLDNGGIINFMLKEGKIHLAINLKAAQRANLQISSKLLSVADVVRQ